MLYTSREKLTVLEIDDDTESVSLDVLADLLLERPSNMVYCVNSGGVLQGIISTGDIHRAAEDGLHHVNVNKRFTKLDGYEYMRARQIFLENEKINALPIVDSENRLLGDYARWDGEVLPDELDFLCRQQRLEKDQYMYIGVKERHIKNVAFVAPGGMFPKKKVSMDRWRQYMEENGIKTEVLDYRQTDFVEACERNDMVLFTDKDIMSGVGTLYRDVFGKPLLHVQTIYEKFYSNNNDEFERETMDKISDRTIRDLSKSGISIMTINFKKGGNVYWKNLEQSINEKFSRIKKPRTDTVYEEWRKDFFDELYSYEYAKKICTLPFAAEKRNGIIMLKDADTQYYHVKDGERLTVGQPDEYKKSIWFFGRCTTYGFLVDDSHTIESYLQGLINEDGYKVRVVNCGAIQNEMALLRRMCATEFKKGDIVVVYCENKSFEGIPNLNLADCVERENVSAKWVSDKITHCNHKLNKLYAEEIYQFLQDKLDEESADEKADGVTLPIDIWVDAYLERYFGGVKPTGTVGSIVMNCNPFTYGHRYLIEQAMEQVDNLIIFVVQEDESLFTFRERFAMVREGTKDLKNVTVVPSGDFILSQLTFPEYFIKVEDEDLEYNTEYDITLFAEEVAPKLNITVRFVGEEKTDEVTNQYNLAMKKILPEHGIQVVEIPRKTMPKSEEPISATKVREILEKNGELTDLIPESTRKLLLQTWE